MPVISDFGLNLGEDLTVNLAVAPPTNVSGWALQFQVLKRFGGVSGLITKVTASGYNNVSGINVVDGPGGVMNVAIAGADTSGWNEGAYAYMVQRTNSGFVKNLSQGYVLVTR